MILTEQINNHILAKAKSRLICSKQDRTKQAIWV